MANETQQIITVEFQPKGESRLIKAIEKLDAVSKKLIQTQDGQFRANRKVSQTFTSLDAKLKAVGSSMSKAGVNGRLLTQAMKGQKVALEKVRIAVEKHMRSLKGLDHRTRILGGTFAVIRSKMLLFSFAMSLGIRQLGRFAVQASKVESMSRAFNTLTGGTEDSSIAFNKLQQATNGTMSEFDLFQQANNAMILGVSKNSDEMAEMFDIAQRLGRALGRDTASSVESLITGIGRQSRLMLDNIGIIVKSQEAYDKYAQKLGISSDKLTDAQKKQAFLEATMESARAKANTLGAETESTQDAFDRLSSSTENLVAFLGDKLSPITTQLANDFANMADTITGKGMKEQEDKQQKLNELLVEYNFRQKDASRLIDEQVVSLDKLMNVFFDESQPLGVRAELLSLSTDELKKQIQLYDDLFFKAVEFQGKQTNFNDIFRSNNEINLELNKVATKEIQNQKVSLEFLNDEQRAGVRLATTIGDAFAQATLHGQNFGEAVVNSLKAIASQLIAQAGAFALINMFTGGVFGQTTSFLKFAGFAHTGGYIKEDKTIQRFATGGQVQGEDNVPIMAQAGEFVMSRNAVDSIGIDNLARMNQTGNAGVTVNISAPLVDETVVDTIIPAIEKAQRMNLA
jgi:hypothetical protein